jgi:hypothetical protein
MPQISEHCPDATPGRLNTRKFVFNRPGVASALSPMLGMVHECKTSVDVTRMLIEVKIGKIMCWFVINLEIIFSVR